MKKLCDHKCSISIPHLSKFYESLYNLHTGKHIYNPSLEDINAFIEPLQFPSISDNQLSELASPFTQQKISRAIDSLPLHKTPGRDGLTNEYYKTFKTILISHMTNMFVECSEKGSLPLPKARKDNSLPNNYRHISLLNCDTKLYAKILACRLLKTLPSPIHTDQVGFTPNRQGPDGTCRFLNIVKYIENNHIPLVILSLDAEKAFDRIHWIFLRTVLNKLGIVGEPQKAMLALYSQPSAIVNAARFRSLPFDVNNGTQQRCPLSPLLFLVIMEHFAHLVRKDPLIKGIHP